MGKARAVFHMEIAVANAEFCRVLSVTTEQEALDEANRVQREATQAANIALDVAEAAVLQEERQANEAIEHALRLAVEVIKGIKHG